MKQSEKEIIQYLRKGKRVNISEIARHLNLPISTVRDRIKRIDDSYIIKRSSILDYPKIGYTVHSIIAIKVDQKHRFSLLDFLRKQNCINSIYYTDSGFNFMVEIICKDHADLIQWIDDTKSMFNVELTHFQILKTEEKEKFIPE